MLIINHAEAAEITFRSENMVEYRILENVHLFLINCFYKHCKVGTKTLTLTHKQLKALMDSSYIKHFDAFKLKVILANLKDYDA